MGRGGFINEERGRRGGFPNKSEREGHFEKNGGRERRRVGNAGIGDGGM